MFKLALALGRTIGDIERLDINEFVEWMAYNELDPIGEWRSDVRAALICDTLAKVFGGSTTTTIDSFMLKFGNETAERPASPEDLKAKVLMITMIQREIVEANKGRNKE
jgi:Protein of unknown function (DUF4035)